MSLLARKSALLSHARRTLATAAVAPERVGGDISDAFSSLLGKHEALAPRFANLKQSLWRDEMLGEWKDVLGQLEIETSHISKQGSKLIPRLTFSAIKSGSVDPSIYDQIREVGSVIVEGAVSEEEALQWKADILEYAKQNKEHVRGFPQDNIQVYEFYNTKAQTSARTHPGVVATQVFLLSDPNLCHASDAYSKISLTTPISYYDRLRIRQPGDARFALGPHVDGGSLERWEDAGYRACFKAILEPSSATSWRSHDSFDASPRIDAITDLYKIGSGQCSVFRPWQGWTSLSNCSPGEGTLRVFPSLKIASAYIMLRPFFSPKNDDPRDLALENWVVDLKSTNFPGSQPGRGQELTSATHPHLRLDETMVSVPSVRPGDQVYWHQDVIHSVEQSHKGKSDSSVLYIPAIPLTIENAKHLALQASAFAQGLPSPDFPQGQGESLNVGRSKPEDVTDRQARQLLGLEPFDIPESSSPGEEALIQEVNKTMFG